jgi:hypothetical protein
MGRADCLVAVERVMNEAAHNVANLILALFALGLMILTLTRCT